MSAELKLEDVLAMFEDVAAKTDVDGDWSPPAGNYTVQLTELANGVKQKDEGPFAWFRATCKILDEGEHTDKNFSIFMGIGKRDDGAASGGLKNFLRLATVIAGVPIQSIAQAKVINEFAAASGETILRLRVFTMGNGNSGYDFQSCEAEVDGIEDLLTQLEAA